MRHMVGRFSKTVRHSVSLSHIASWTGLPSWHAARVALRAGAWGFLPPPCLAALMTVLPAGSGLILPILRPIVTAEPSCAGPRRGSPHAGWIVHSRSQAGVDFVGIRSEEHTSELQSR